jgi:predicted RND superfamily exporter protein
LYRGVGAIVLFGLFFATLVTLVFLPSVLVEVLSWRSRSASKGAEASAKGG